ncbi:uncharacterized protein [Triticum aestivum]|uniref:uncharacterized protein n=1 Tax=Triticum aestivum TaxID=4565 RepID=UPI001D00AEF1|nr:uncharacterized protein LOC123125394 [Triticum aestivum]
MDMLPRGTDPSNRAKPACHLGSPLPPALIEYDLQCTDDDKATIHDSSRRALWNLNLKAQKLREGLLSEHAYLMNRNLGDLKKEAMESPTDVGSGYIDFRFLHSSDQPNYLD